MVIVTEALLERHPGASEGDIAWMRQEVVDQHHCADAAVREGLPARMRATAPASADPGLGDLPSVQAALTEAVIGAAWTALPRDDVDAAVRAAFAPALDAARPGHRDPKTALQELVQRDGGRVTYEPAGHQGPAHDRVFTVRVLVGDRAVADGAGPSKRQAERHAAQAALERLQAEPGEGTAPPPSTS